MKLIDKVPHTPCYVLDVEVLKKNLEILKKVQEDSGCKILLALKGFSMFSIFPLINQYLEGISASSLNEARLGCEEFSKQVHIFSPAYIPEEFPAMLNYATHIIFNSFTQWKKYKPDVHKAEEVVKCGLRINPEHSEVKVSLYDPCASRSRLGIRREEFNGEDLVGISGLHFHNLCELNSDSLERTLQVVEDKFSDFLPKMEWVNFGGGHHITRKDYDVERLCRIVKIFKEKYDVEVFIEPGEAVVLNAGYLVASVLDIVHNEGNIAILDTSAAAHMPDVLEMPYRPEIDGAGKTGEYKNNYRLGGLTCLAGDVIGDYSFKEPLESGDRLIFKDMAHYTMVKNNTFNGMCLPSIFLYHSGNNEIELVKEFGYQDYRNRLS